METKPSLERANQMSYPFFAVIDNDLEIIHAKLPTTIPIGSTIEGYERAGYSVRWTWMKECPNHEGNFDCTPFCPLCEGDQEITA
jgi:hypothetical protein